MSRRSVAPFVLVSFGLVLLGPGCKSDEERFCEVIRKNESDYSDEECKGDLQDIKRRCSNPDMVISCATGGATRDALQVCRRKCKEKE